MDLTVYSIDGITPVVDPTAFVHPSAVLIGDVIVGAGCYVGPGACLRGDFGHIDSARGANIQDTCVLHGFPGTDTIVEEDGHIGHGVVLHGCIVRRNALVGMNAVVNDNAEIGESAIVAAMAVVKAKMVVPPRTLVAGIPARVVRDADRDRSSRGRSKATDSYQEPRGAQPAHDARDRAADAAPEPDRKRIELPDLPKPLSDTKSRVASRSRATAARSPRPGRRAAGPTRRRSRRPRGR